MEVSYVVDEAHRTTGNYVNIQTVKLLRRLNANFSVQRLYHRLKAFKK